MLLLKSISNTDTTLSVTVDAAMPASNGVIQIGSERIIYDDNYMGTLYGCLRGAQSTVAAPHILGTTVSLVNFYSAFPGTPDVSSASNVGTGEGTFAQKVLDDLQFKSLVEGTNVTITSTPTEITIASTDTGEVNTASNVGSGAGLFAQKILADLQFKSLTAGTNIVLTPSTDDITVTLTDSITLLAGTESAPAIQVSDGLGSGGGMYANDAYSGNPGLALSYLDTGTYYTGLVVNPNGVQIIDKNGAGSATIYFWPLNNTLPEASSLSRSTVGLFSLNNTELVDGTPDIRLLINQEGDYPIEFNTNSNLQLKIDGSVTAGDTRLLLWDVDSGALVRVSVGADDSAGVGYKVLRVPN